jgi:hypothetical protein
MQKIVFLEFEKARLTLVPALLSIALDGKAPTCRRSSVSAPFGVPKLGLRSKFILRHRAPDLIILQTIIECSSGKNIEACLEGGPFDERLTTARAIFGLFPFAIFGAAKVPLAKSGRRLLKSGEWRLETRSRTKRSAHSDVVVTDTLSLSTRHGQAPWRV